MKKVLIIYNFLPQYRIEFYEKLKESLLDVNIELVLIYGKLKNDNSKKNDERDLDWAIYRENKVLKIGSTNLLWQPCLDMISKIDLVIVEQANRLLVNYPLIFLSKIMKFKLGFWGHGANLQKDLNGIRNKFKYIFLNLPDHWFAYTKGVQRFLIGKGVSRTKITAVNNAIDTVTLKKQYDKLSKEEVNKFKTGIGIISNHVAIYCGGIYKEKRMDFLIEASMKIRESIEDFNILIVGSGPESSKIEDIAKKIDWIYYFGSKFGSDKVPYFKISDIFLIPGAVGLAVLDAFAMQTPMVTTQTPYHGPEIEYLIDGENGIYTENNIDDYSNKVINLFRNKDKLKELKIGCLKSSMEYNTENMVSNFKNGILQCLNI